MRIIKPGFVPCVDVNSVKLHILDAASQAFKVFAVVSCAIWSIKGGVLEFTAVMASFVIGILLDIIKLRTLSIIIQDIAEQQKSYERPIPLIID